MRYKIIQEIIRGSSSPRLDVMSSQLVWVASGKFWGWVGTLFSDCLKVNIYIFRGFF